MTLTVKGISATTQALDEFYWMESVAMGREVRMVPADWQHPTEWVKDFHTNRPRLSFKPLFEGDFDARMAEWDAEKEQWDAGLVRDYENDGWKSKPDDVGNDFTEWHGARPDPNDYMPKFPDGTATHFMMYEDTTEGTPISPAFATPEELATWLAENNASAFGGEGATYDQWLRVCRGGFAPSLVLDASGLRSGVVALAD